MKVKRRFSILMCMVLLITLLPTTALAAGDAPDAGSGTAADPYIIDEPSELVWMSENFTSIRDKYFRQTSDINMAGIDFTPIGNGSTDNSGSMFTGQYDGQAFEIQNLTINSGLAYVALFQYVGGMVKNVTLTNADITSTAAYTYSAAAGIAGYLSSGTIQNCSVSGTVSLTGAAVYSYTGGIAGSTWGAIQDCFNTAALNNVNSGASIGGIAAYTGNASVNILRCYFTGSMSGAAAIKGGVVGNAYQGTISNNVFLSTAAAYGRASSSSNEGCFPASGTQMKTQATFESAGWDFTNIWKINEGVGYPVHITAPSKPVNLVTASDDGQIRLSWDAAERATGYLVYYGADPGVYGTPISSSDTSEVITGLTNYETYYFAVRGLHNTEEGPLSDQVSGSPHDMITDLAAVPEDKRVELTFSAPIGASEVYLLQSDDGGLSFTDTGISLTSASTSATVTGLTNEAEYLFKLRLLYGTVEYFSNTVTVYAGNGDATLSALTVSGCTLSPSFAPGTYNYSTSVTPNVDTVSVTATVNSGSSTLYVASALQESGTGKTVSLQYGTNTIHIWVDAQNGDYLGYTITITRQLPASAVTVNAAASIDDTNYPPFLFVGEFSGAQENAALKFDLSPYPASLSYVALKIYTSSADSTGISGSYNLYGSADDSWTTALPSYHDASPIRSGVTRPDSSANCWITMDVTDYVRNHLAATDNTVTFYLEGIRNGTDIAFFPADSVETVYRPQLLLTIQSTDARLSGISIGGTPLSGFSSDTEVYSYTAPSGTDPSALAFTSTVNDAGATQSAWTYDSVNKKWSVTVTAEDGKTTKTYTVTVEVPLTYSASVSPTEKIFTAATAGYSQQTAQSFTIENTGTGAITGLSAALGGTDFEISEALSSDTLNAGSTTTIGVRPVTGLAANTYTDTLTISGNNGISLTIDLSFTVNPEATYGINLDKTGTYTFSGKTAGYASVTPLTVTVSNTGNQATGALTVALSGTNHGSYTLSKTTIDSITASGSDTFTVAPNTGLSIGTYTATVTVSGGSNITEQAFTVSFTVEPTPVVNASISPDTGSFDKKPANQADVQTTVTWGSATGITDVKAAGISIGAGNYSVSGNTLTIKKGYLASQSTGSLSLTVEFDQGTAATLTVAITDTTPPAISPEFRNYDLNAPADVTTVISWNSATTVAGVVFCSAPLTYNTDYTVTGDTLTILESYLSGLTLKAGDTIDFVITFDTVSTATLTVNVVNGYVPGNNADLSSLSVNGTPVSGFDPDVTTYNIELPPGTSVATVTATTADPNAGYIVTQAPSLPGSATVTVTAENGTTTKTYTIDFTIGAPPTVFVTSITVTGMNGAAGMRTGSTLQMLAGVLPANATNKDVTWSIVSGGGASISASGLLTATAAGLVTVRATALDGSGVFGEATITVTTEPPSFVPVTGITGVPTIATAGTPLTLSGTVVPSNATNKAIIWSVKTAGNTGAAITGNILSTKASGAVIVTAKISNGFSKSLDYKQDFTITVSTAPITTYTITFNNNGAVYATKTVKAGDSIGSSKWPADPVRASYTFGGWFTGQNGAGARFTSATPVNASATVYAKWTYNGGSDSSSGGGSTTPPAPVYDADINTGSGPDSTLPVTVDKNSGNANVDIGSENSLMSDGKTTVISVPPIPGVDTYTLGMPVSSLSTSDRQGALTFKTDKGSVTVPSNMLTGLAGITGGKAEISIGQGDKTGLPGDIKAAIGDRPLVQLALSIDGKQLDWNNPDAPVTISIPYKPTATELANPESIIIWYIDGSGNAVSVPNGNYDPATGAVTFATTHFSNYAVIYNNVSFNDVATSAWYYKPVSFIAARGITAVTDKSKFNPEAKLTRGQFIVMLMKAYSIAPDANPKNNFADAGSSYYTGYLAAAKRLGISEGMGNNLFAPDKEITRQEMFTLLYNALKVIGKLPRGNSSKSLSDFSDAGQIASWAQNATMLLVETGTIGGNAGKLNPMSTTTRGEIAQVLYNLLKK